MEKVNLKEKEKQIYVLNYPKGVVMQFVLILKGQYVE